MLGSYSPHCIRKVISTSFRHEIPPPVSFPPDFLPLTYLSFLSVFILYSVVRCSCKTERQLLCGLYFNTKCCCRFSKNGVYAYTRYLLQYELLRCCCRFSKNGVHKAFKWYYLIGFGCECLL